MAAKQKAKASKHAIARHVAAAKHARVAVASVHHRVTPKVIHRPSRRARTASQPLQSGVMVAEPVVKAEPKKEEPAVAVPKIEIAQPTPVDPLAANTAAKVELSPEVLKANQIPAGFEIITKQVNGKPVQVVRFRRPVSQSAPGPKKQASGAKKLSLAAIPGFFGLMGLSQLYQGRKATGLLFMGAGAFASFLSSWYIILLARIDAGFTHGVMLPAYALSFLSSTGLSASLASKLSIDLLGVVAVLWALQLFDAMGPFVRQPKISDMTVASGPKVTIPLPGVRRAIVSAPSPPFKSVSQAESSVDQSEDLLHRIHS